MDANNSMRSTCEEPAPPGTSPPMTPDTPKPAVLSKGVENAKKRLRAFSIQKKTTPLSPVVPKPISTGNNTVLIGKLSGVKPSPKVEEDPQKKQPRPPKPGAARKFVQDSYSDQQKRTLSEIEDMKRKMELVDLGIPLGLICPTSSDDKAMPTKAMPPIKTFLDPAKVDELIREAKKARVEGREFKFDYQKILPDYDNPFQRKREDLEKDYKYDRRRSGSIKRDRKVDKHEFRRYPDYRKDDRDKYKDKDKDKSKDRSKGKKDSSEKAADVNLKDFLVCDSWSENDDKNNSSSPNHDEKGNTSIRKSPEKKDFENKLQSKSTEKIVINVSKEPSQYFKDCLMKKIDVVNEPTVESPNNKPCIIEKLQPVIDCFKFEIDPNDDEILDIFDEGSSLEKYSQVKQKTSSFYSSPRKVSHEHTTKDMSMDGMNDDTFLESVINEIRQDDNMCDDTSQDKRLVEYDESPNKDEYDSPVVKANKERKRASVTPEMDEKMKEQTKRISDFNKKESSKQKNDYYDRNDRGSERREYSDRKDQVSQRNEYSDVKDQSSQRSKYSERRQSTESGYKTSDTNKSDSKYVDNFRLSIEKELDDALERSMNRSTVESLETWSFVLKICQPLLFRHDKNKCYRETSVTPKIWYTENPKTCSCVKDRVIVYEELEMLKMGLVDRVYGCDQLADTPSVNARAWYPRSTACLVEGRVQPVAVDWEADDSQLEAAHEDRPRMSLTPQREDEIMLDREYQRFMEAVWPDVAEAKASETSRSTTPVRHVSRRKKKEEDEPPEMETDDKKAKKIKLSSEGWSQESDIEEEVEKTKKNKIKDKKSRKRKRSTSTLSSITDSDGSSRKKRKMGKIKATKKVKSKEAKRRRMGQKLLKKLKEKEKQKKKSEKEELEELELEEAKKKEMKKAKKRKQQKLKKKRQKRRRKTSSSSIDSSSSTGSDSDAGTRRSKSKKRKRAEAKKRKRDKRKKSSSESQSEDLFDVNILNNIKTERLTDDEKCQKLMEFSPRIHHKPREIINVKELQNDFVGNNNIHIKKEAEDPKEATQELGKENDKGKVDEEEISSPLYEREGVLTNLEDLDIVVPLPVDPPTVEAEKYEDKIVPAEVLSGRPINILESQEHVISSVPTRVVDESNLSQCSSQESVCSVKESSSYEKDESHLRPSSQNSNYSFNDVIASQGALYQKSIETIVDSQDKYGVSYDREHESGTYEMYEQLAMAYQSDVASLLVSQASPGLLPQRIETVVRARARGEIKCDWRARTDHAPTAPPINRPSRWGLKPSDVNIVLTGGEQDASGPAPVSALALPPATAPAPQPVYRIQSLANRTDVAADYDEAYMDMYGASDRLQYGDCFAADAGGVVHSAPPPVVTDVALVPMPSSPVKATPNTEVRSTLDARIDQALREAALSELAAAAVTADEHKDLPEKGILVTAAGGATGAAAGGAVGGAGRGAKRVSFADGYQPGQDSDLEEPPVKKRKKLRRTGCAWPCPATHPDHVPLWDALPPPPPPPGDPPSCRQALRRTHSADSSKILSGFMPPEPPPGLISF